MAVCGSQRRTCAGCAGCPVSWGGREGLGKESSESQSCAGRWDYNRSSLERISIALAMGVALDFGRGIQ